MIYVGLTNDLKNILKKHRALRMKCTKGNFGLNKLVHVEEYHDANQAVLREKELKNAPRSLKSKLLSNSNPKWECIQSYWIESMERALVK
jgi:putative endonuclease